MSTQISQSYSFSPPKVDSCYVWLDASTSTNFTFSSGSNIATWIDRSGNGYTATAVNNPTYDSVNMRVRFNNASSQSMSNLSAPLNLQQRSFFFVIEDVTYVPVGGYMPIIPNPTSGTDYQTTTGLTIENNVGFKWYGNSGGYNNQINGPASPNPKGIYSEVFGSLSGTTYYNGTAGGASNSSYTPGTSTGYALGARWANGIALPYINSYYYEIIVYNTALTTSERQQVEGYLAWKWNLVSNLPASHPYKKNQPFMNVYSLPLVPTTPQSAFNQPIFIPTQISGCVVWFDAADRSTLTFAGATTVTTWRSKGSSVLFANSDGGGPIQFQPYNGKNALRFNGINTNMTTGTISSYATTGTTWISASVNLTPFSPSTPVDASVVFATPSAPERSIRYTQGTAQIYTFNNGVIRYSSDTNSGVRGFIDTAASFIAYVNGSDTTTSTTAVTFQAGANQTFVMGKWSSGCLDGYIQEIIVYNRALSLSEYQQVESYLAWKWGFQTSLPSNFPTKNSPFPGISSVPDPIYPPRITSSSWQPTQLSDTGFSLWLDAADVTSVNLLGTQVTQWRDKSGNGNDASVSGTIRYTGKIGKFTAMSYPGTFSTYFKGSVSNSGPTLSAFAVYLMNSASSTVVRVLSLAVAGEVDWQSIQNTSALIRQTSVMTSYRNYAALGNSTAVFGTPVLVACVFDGVTQTFYTNGTAGTSAASTGNFGYNTYEIGASLQEESAINFDGFIGEILHFTAALSNLQRQQVEGYLAWKWGLQTSLPGNHPYRLFPPAP